MPISGRGAELRLAFKVTIAAILAFTLARLLGFSHGLWAVITAIIVMQTSVGGSLKAAIDRLLGTMAGALYGAIIAFSIPHGTTAGLSLAIVMAIAPLALLAAIKASFKVAPVTAFIVLVPIGATQVAPFTYALDRIFEISIGSLVGLVVALLVLPSRAHQLLIEAAGRVADLNADLMILLMDSLTSDIGRTGIQATHGKIRASLKQMEAAAEEASRERKSHLTDQPDPEPLVRTCYRVRHDLVMVGRAAARPLPPVLVERLGQRLAAIKDSASELLRKLAQALREGMAAPAPERFEAALRNYAADMEEVWKHTATHPIPAEEAGRIFALRFALEQLNQDCRDLANRITEIAEARSRLKRPPRSLGQEQVRK